VVLRPNGRHSATQACATVRFPLYQDLRLAALCLCSLSRGRRYGTEQLLTFLISVKRHQEDLWWAVQEAMGKETPPPIHILITSLASVQGGANPPLDVGHRRFKNYRHTYPGLMYSEVH